MEDIETENLQLLDFATYNDYLKSFIRQEDSRYLSNIKTRFTVVKLGYRSTNPVYTEEEFVKQKAAAKLLLSPKITGAILYSKNCVSTDPALIAFKAREQLNLQKTMSTIIFMNCQRKGGDGISGYIDFEQSLRRCNQGIIGATDWNSIFAERKNLRPKPNHLSYYNSRYKIIAYNNSDNFKVVHDHDFGLMFMHRGDHKRIPIGISPKVYGENVIRTVVFSPRYHFVIFYDHYVRKKN